MTLKTKLYLAFGLFFGAVLLLAFLGGVGIFRQNDATKIILEDNYESLDYAQEMLRSLDRQDWVVFSQNIDHQQRNVTEPGEQEATDALTVGFAALQNAAADSPQAQHADSTIRDCLHRIWDINQGAILQKTDRARQVGEQAFQIIGMLSTVLVLLAFTFLLNLPGYISRPITALRDGIRQLVQRDYTARVEVRSRDELGELAGAFNDMAQKLDFWEHSNWAQVLFEKSRIETIIQQMQDAIIGLDERQQVLFLNSAMERLLGLSAKDVVGKNALEVALRNDLLRHLLRPAADEKGDLKIYFEERECFFDTEKTDVQSVDRVIGQVILLKNVTAFRASDSAKNNFIAAIAHELKTPVASIQTALQLLENEPLNDGLQKALAQIREDIERLLSVTSELQERTG